mmetsp:Transcript_16762/g.32634  ORF Transcript_16762/g.32634 Transcript_16762/m.32634 type:complete len:111 (-) Transcript_16762:64-396(-)
MTSSSSEAPSPCQPAASHEVHELISRAEEQVLGASGRAVEESKRPGSTEKAASAQTDEEREDKEEEDGLFREGDEDGDANRDNDLAPRSDQALGGAVTAADKGLFDLREV